MTSETSWDRVQRFVRRYIRTIEQLEVLLLLARTPERHWSAAEAARELGIAALDAGDALEQLTAANLLDVRLLDDVRYRLSTADPEVYRGVQELQAVYNVQRIRVTAEVMKRRAQPMRDFADAFRLQKKKEDEDDNG